MHKRLAAKDRAVHLHHRAKKFTTYQEYGWMRNVEPHGRKVGNSTSIHKHGHYGTPQGIKQRIFNKREIQKMLVE